MSEARHTPAPWAVYPTEFEDGSEAYDVMADGAAIVIASPPSHADARLIAAAPDLLAACEAFLNRHDYLTNLWGGEGISRGIADKVRAAVRKAKGEP